MRVRIRGSVALHILFTVFSLVCFPLPSMAALPKSSPQGRRTAAVLGATGAVGQQVVRALLQRGWSNVHLLNRREMGPIQLDNKDNDDALKVASRIHEHIVPMADGASGGPLEAACGKIFHEHAVDALFITMGVGAPSKYKGQEGADLLKRVDVQLPTACARGARSSSLSVAHVSILTAVGADVDSVPDTSDRLFGMISRARAGGGLYNHCKGRVEQNIRDLGFPSFSTFRPAALLGTPNTPRSVAFICGLLDPLLPALYKSSKISTLGEAMVLDAEEKLDAVAAVAAGHGETEAAGAGLPAKFRFDVFEGGPLHALYARTKRGADGTKENTKKEGL